MKIEKLKSEIVGLRKTITEINLSIIDHELEIKRIYGAVKGIHVDSVVMNAVIKEVSRIKEDIRELRTSIEPIERTIQSKLYKLDEINVPINKGIKI